MINLIRAVLRGQTNKARAAHLKLGELGERMAIDYLNESEGYQIVCTNFRVPLGRGLHGQKLTAEIDVIAYDGGTLTFVEVKTRTSDELVAPEQRQIARAARRYRQLTKVYEEPYRYDVVTVVPGSRGGEIELLRGYFDDRVFQKSRYFRSDA
jgi:putative endonuclease